MDNANILQLTKTNCANYDKLFAEVSNLISQKHIHISQVALYLFVCRHYISNIKSDKERFLNLVKTQSGFSREHRLFAYACEYLINHDPSLVYNATEFLLRNYSKTPDELIQIDDNEEISNFFIDRRSYDLMSAILRWSRKFKYNPDDLECIVCGNIMLPDLKKMDSYRCTNLNCRHSKEYYSSHCWSCGDPVDSDHNFKCGSCDWYICRNCGKCEEHNKCHNQQPLISKILSAKKIDEAKTSLDHYYRGLVNHFLANPNQFGINQTRRGTKILISQSELDYYNLAYFRMHYLKLQDALIRFPNNFNQSDFMIIDWGCGQGIGSLTFLEKYQANLNGLKSILLIEPSTIALERARENIKSFFSYPVERIVGINECLEKLDINKITLTGSVVHIMSNILDVNIDLKLMFDLIQKYSSVKQYFVCVSPNYFSARTRFNGFYNHLKNNFGVKKIDVSKDSIQSEIFYLTQRRFVRKNIHRIHMILEKL